MTQEAGGREFFETSTLVPALATVAALLNDEGALQQLRDEIVPLMKNVTLERWFPEASLETLTGSTQVVQNVGVSKALVGFRASAGEEAEVSVKPFPGAASASEFKWYQTQWQVLVALSARIHRHPLPTWFLAEYRRSEHPATRSEP